MNQENAGTTSYNPLVGEYLTNFLNLYYASFTSDSDKCTQQLSQYLASNLTLPESDENSNLKLNAATLTGIFIIDGVNK
ncbi:hypothetical protein KIJ05_08870 [Leuconostoc gelidum subsp. gasicomitatum]|uniref:hypothetical protein n=1 Tax=Leuconostoc gasicomitatum TaxID=115778 RepID=UPI001CC74F71|nr:hypothetical protein [Leuconostoc gasicomitatum]MBZ5985222.1 hypothetical protein [Leuconostoc gasicomitatum]